MSRTELWLLHAATLLVGGTGIVYAWMLYFLKPADPFAVVHHPWQPGMQHLHVVVAPLLVFAAGLIWRRHVWGGWRSGQRARRRSGVALASTLLPMVASGYLLQTAVDDAWRKVWVAVHLAASALWLAGYLVHQLTPRASGPHPVLPPVPTHPLPGEGDAVGIHSREDAALIARDDGTGEIRRLESGLQRRNL